MASVTITQQWENGQATQVKAEGWEFDAGGMAEVAETALLAFRGAMAAMETEDEA